MKNTDILEKSVNAIACDRGLLVMMQELKTAVTSATAKLAEGDSAATAAFMASAAAAEEYNKAFTKKAFDTFLADAYPLKAALTCGLIRKATVRLTDKTDDEGHVVRECKLTVKSSLLDLPEFAAYAASKGVTVLPENWPTKVSEFNKDVCAKALQSLFLDVTEEKGETAKRVAMAKFMAKYGCGNAAAAEQLSLKRSAKVELKSLRALVALPGLDVVPTKAHVAWLNVIVLGKGKSVFSLSLPKDETMVKWLTEMMVAMVNNLELEVLQN